MKMIEIKNLMIDFFGKDKVNTKGFDYFATIENFTERYVWENGRFTFKPWDGRFEHLEVSHLELRFFNDLRKRICGRIKCIEICTYIQFNNKAEVDTDKTNILTTEGPVSINASMNRIGDFSKIYDLLWKIEYDEYDKKLPAEYTLKRYPFDEYVALLKHLRATEQTDFLEDRRKRTEEEDRCLGLIR